VLFVHGDDDRNLPFQQTTDLVEKLRAQNVASRSFISVKLDFPTRSN
jgi:dipeptidyl aminopeptidase/acylaminoacyl peptidase